MFYQFNHFGFSEYFKNEYGENFSFPVHLHHSFEFVTILDGEMKITVDETVYTLKKGESLLIFPNQTHSFESVNSKHTLCIFSPELVKAYAERVRHLRPESAKFVADDYLISALNNLEEKSGVFEKKGVLYSICATFDKSAKYISYKNPDKALLMNVFSYIEDNFQKECSLKELSNITGYSYSYISRSFKKITGISFNTYLNQYRIRNACYLLLNTNNTILQCALDSGYTSLRSFNRNFSEFLNMSPKDYRKKQGM